MLWIKVFHFCSGGGRDMFRNCFTAFWIAGALAFFYTEAPAWAAEVTYPGNSPANSPFGVLDSFFAGASLSGNTVTVTGGSLAGEVAGGIVNGAGNVSDNTVHISGTPTIGDMVSGGRTVSGNAVGNTIIIDGGTIASFVRGGQTVSGKALSNTVTLNGGNLAGVTVGYLQGGTVPRERPPTISCGCKAVPSTAAPWAERRTAPPPPQTTGSSCTTRSLAISFSAAMPPPPATPSTTLWKCTAARSPMPWWADGPKTGEPPSATGRPFPGDMSVLPFTAGSVGSARP